MFEMRVPCRHYSNERSDRINNIIFITICCCPVLVIAALGLHYPTNRMAQGQIFEIKARGNNTSSRPKREWSSLSHAIMSTNTSNLNFKHQVRPAPLSSQSKQPNHEKLAFLFLLKDTMNFSDVWKEYFHSLPPDSFKVVLHFARNNGITPPSSIPFEHTIAEHRPSRWCKLLQPIHSLLETGFNDPDVFGAVFLSDTTIPIKTALYAYKNLKHARASVFNFVPGSNRRKSSMWGFLQRDGMEKVVEESRMLNWTRSTFPFPPEFRNFKGCPDEYYVSTIIGPESVEDGITTAECWGSGAGNVKSPKVDGFCDTTVNADHPTGYKTLEGSVLVNLWNETGALFLRKVSKRTIIRGQRLGHVTIQMLTSNYSWMED
mmetsp:Transcript_30429/g.90843  ORF Transcript_30429/g.90843 Transcript_30429/m.90843 type:complete len:375 (-) Transcript_30429:402-1526(-)